jgi:hypothetical protein
MVRLAIACTIFALAGCASDPQPPASSAKRPGDGLIESISLVAPPASAAAGGTAPPAPTGPYRVTVRKDDGAVQTFTVDSRAYLVGDRVQVSADGRLIRH